MFDGSGKSSFEPACLADLKPKIVDFRFTDLPGRWGHVCHWIDGIADIASLSPVMLSSASIMGWNDAAQSEIALRPIEGTQFLDPFAEERTVVVNCHLVDPGTGRVSDKDSRATLERACLYLAGSGVADAFVVGAELEFYLFDDIRFRHSANETFVSITESDGLEAAETRSRRGGVGHRISYPAHHFATGPADWANAFRSSLLKRLADIGVPPLHHQHEDGPGQQEICLRHADAVTAADRVQATKYVVLNGADAVGQTATFMPKPMAYRPGSGMHMNVSLWKAGDPVLAGDEIAGFSSLGLSFLAGILAHSRALTAILNPSINSFKRLDAIVNPMARASYGIGNRTVPRRIPSVFGAHEKRIEVRFGDATANPYLAFAAILLAGLDGIERGMKPPAPHEGDLLRENAPYDPRRCTPDGLCRSLDEAIVALDADSNFLLKGGSFTSALLAAHIGELCRQVRVCRALPHPNEFLMSYGA